MIATKGAEAAYQNARLTREVAEIAVDRVRRGDLQAGLRDRQGGDRPGRIRPDPRRGPPRVVEPDVPEGLCLEGPEDRRRPGAEEGHLHVRAGADQAEGARGLHQEEDDQGAGERGREGAVRRAGQGADLEPGEVEGGEAREADRELQALRPRRRPGRLRQRPEPLRRQQPAADRGRGDRPRAAEDLQPARHQQDAGQHQGPRVDDRPALAGPPRPDPGRRLRRPGPDRHGRVGGPPARPEQLLQLGRQGLHHARLDRARATRASGRG